MTPMFILLGMLSIGFLLRKINLPKIPSWVLTGIVSLLLFFFGAAVGADKAVEAEIGHLGAKALLLGLAGAIGSAVAAYGFLQLLDRYRKRK